MEDLVRTAPLKLSLRDFLSIAFLLIFSIALVFNVRSTGYFEGWDQASYVKMAEKPVNMQKVMSHHGQRIFGPTLVWGLRQILPLSMEAAFRFFAAAAFASFVLLFYFALRGLQVGPITAVTTTVFSIISFWPITYTLSNVYQLTDGFAYPLIVLTCIFFVRKNYPALLIVSLVGVLVRQNLMFLGAFVFSQLFWNTREKKYLWGLLSVIGLFVLSGIFAGRLDARADSTNPNALYLLLVEHPKNYLLHFPKILQNFVRGFFETKMLLMFSPFLPLLFFRPIFSLIVQF